MQTVKILAAFLVIAFACANTFAETHKTVNSQTPVSDLIAVDKAFNERAQEIGVAEAFAEFAAPDAVMYRNGAEPIEGREAVFKVLAAEQGVTLKWVPLTGDIAASGDLGYTRGSFELIPPAAPDATATPGSYKGYYVSIWKKQPDGSWKWVFDSGVVSEVPAP
jgi:ketosteroid isomerase-like protein